VTDLRLGVVGAGIMGRIHARNIAHHVPGARLAAVADVDLGLAKELADALGAPDSYSSFAHMLDAGALDAVVVATPRDTHADVIEAAAARGVHSFCEKPIAGSLDEANRLLAAVERAGTKLMIGFNRRFDPSVQAAAKGVQSGRLGRVLTAHIIARDPIQPGPKKEPGDLFLETTIHDLDTACWIFGDSVQSITAIGGVAGDGSDDPDWALTLVQFAGGAVATIDNSRLSAHGYDQRLEVVGTGGAVSTDNERLHLATISDPGGELLPPPKPFFTERYAASYIEELGQFARYLRDDIPSPASGQDGLRALTLALAADRSYREGRAVAVNQTPP
jgi:myo-inositol 2-dehydrogenase/D-chiro-inositol 1-dehydrogenase